MKVRLLSIDMQNDFVSEGGRWYKRKECVDYFKFFVAPFLREGGFRLSMIVSDYTLPRNNGSCSYCVPGTWGFESIVPEDLVNPNRWIKAARSPTWVREVSGAYPVQRPDQFTQWLAESVGNPSPDLLVCLMGVDLECCVFCVVQELYLRGYNVMIIPELVDMASGRGDDKIQCLELLYRIWAKPLSWQRARDLLEESKKNE